MSSASLRLKSSLRFLFQENERRHSSGESPFTDAELLVLLAKKHPYSEGLKSMLQGKLTINYYRNRINLGTFGRHDDPLDPPSFRYNHKGQRVSGRNPKVPLTYTKQQQIIRSLKAKALKIKQRRHEDSWESTASVETV